MITKIELSKIAAYDTKGLIKIHDDLIRERMKLDLEMSDFLRLNEDPMGYDREEHADIWKEYKKMRSIYSELVQLLTLTEFYMNMKRYPLA